MDEKVLMNARAEYGGLIRRQTELVKAGMPRRDAWHKAADELGGVAHFKQIMRLFHNMPRKNEAKEKPTRGRTPTVFAGKYEQCLREYGYVPDDPIVCLLCGVAPNTPAAVRFRLKSERWDFTRRDDGGWTGEPKPMTPKEQLTLEFEAKIAEIERQFKEALSKL